jgi:hypothetical protein
MKSPVPKALTSKSLFRTDSYFESLLAAEYNFTLQLRARGEANLQETCGLYPKQDLTFKLRFICWEENGTQHRTARWGRILETPEHKFVSEVSNKEGVPLDSVESSNMPEAERKLLILIERDVI